MTLTLGSHKLHLFPGKLSADGPANLIAIVSNGP
ncbi:hypothetical protein EYZ11_008192 [Aspergillus tanneri]|uniref:Uncharacterized protein n=1 Tax=Aspergillus tanneri TaxID=1220188 RepID=A0A4S3JDB1_9EURO|nr:hypothetical protein EYZ11_008192 [Aspergillus tanneri]